jgi:ADP-ribosylglycohydrolase
LERIELAAESLPESFVKNSGWVLTAFQNALFWLLHSSSMEEGLALAVSQGGDADTNGAVCGALLGAVWGEEAVPARWRDKVLSCRPEKGAKGVLLPRPRDMWPIDAIELSDKLIETGLALSVRLRKG